MPSSALCALSSHTPWSCGATYQLPTSVPASAAWLASRTVQAETARPMVFFMEATPSLNPVVARIRRAVERERGMIPEDGA